MDPPGFLKGPGEVEEPGAQSRLEEDENGPEGAEPLFCAHTQRRFGGDCCQPADALSGQLLHAEASRTLARQKQGSEWTGLQGGGVLEEAAGAVLSCSTGTREQNLALRD